MMFKKLVNLLFEEEEIEEMEESFEDDEPVIEIRTKAPEAELPKKAEPVTLKEEKSEPVSEEKTEEIKGNEEPQSKPQESKGIMIDLDPAKPEKINVPKFSTKREIEYEFSPVISPIYGLLEGDKKSVNDLTAPQPKRKVVPNNSLLGTVISPIYGVTKDSKSNMTSNRVVKEEDVENVSLDDLLSKPEPKVDDAWFDTVHQQREDDPNDLDSLIRSLSESEPEKVTTHKIVESQLNLFGDEE